MQYYPNVFQGFWVPCISLLSIRDKVYPFLVAGGAQVIFALLKIDRGSLYVVFPEYSSKLDSVEYDVLEVRTLSKKVKITVKDILGREVPIPDNIKPFRATNIYVVKNDSSIFDLIIEYAFFYEGHKVYISFLTGKVLQKLPENAVALPADAKYIVSTVFSRYGLCKLSSGSTLPAFY